MKIIIIKQVESAYWLDNGVLITAPLSNDNTFDTNEGYEVEKDLIGSEPLPEPYYRAKTFGQLYNIIEKELTN